MPFASLTWRRGWAAMSSPFCCWRAKSAQAVAEALVESLSLPYANVKVAVSASVGIAVYPQSGTTMLQLLERADVALYRARGWASAGSHPTCERSGGRGWRGQLVKLPGFGVPVVRGAGRRAARSRKSQLKSVIGIASSRNAATLSGLAAVALGAPSSA